MTLAPDDLFRCPAVARGLAVKHCLRRQDERRAVLDAKGKAIGEVPVRPECQGCATGAANRAACSPLPTAAPEPASELPGHPAPPAHLWTGDVPDVPLGPPPRDGRSAPAVHAHAVRAGWGATLVLDEAERSEIEVAIEHADQRGHDALVTAIFAPPPAGTAAPPTEETMPKPAKKICPKCGVSPLRSDNTKGICGRCQRRSKPARRAAAKVSAWPDIGVLGEVQEIKQRVQVRLEKLESVIQAAESEAKQLRDFLGMEQRMTAQSVG